MLLDADYDRQIGQDAPEELAGKNFREAAADEPGLIDTSEKVNEKSNSTNIIDDSDIEFEEDIEEITPSESQSSDEEDDTDELLQELEKIKKERELERLAEEARKEAEMVKANPLLNLGEEPSFSVKRRWDDDIVFKNQAKGVDERPKKRFINDTTRSDFHRKFLDKYIR